LNCGTFGISAAVADAGNVSHSARRLHVTQPALSRQISDLDRDLEWRLFSRIGRRIVGAYIAGMELFGDGGVAQI
jgi:DNA-binding transcriptional LysR family regulator